MRCWIQALMAGLAASVALNYGMGDDVPPALIASEGATLAPRPEAGEFEDLVPFTVNVSAHLVATPGGKHLSEKALDGQMDIINRSFAPHNISFALVETEHIIDTLWGQGIDEMRMMWKSNRGDARTLNLYFIERFSDDPTTTGLLYSPDRIPRDLGTYRVDGAIIAAHTVPGGPGWDAATWEGKAAVRGIGYWLGLLGTSRVRCSGQGDYVDDTPAAMRDESLGICPVGLDSCPDQPGLDPIHNFMSPTSDSCKTEFTPGQGRRMHKRWRALREPHRVPTTPPLAPITPLKRETEGKLPYYAKPKSMMAALVECLPHEANVTLETREDHCSTFIYCYFGTWKAANTGEKYTSNNTWIECENARVQPQTDEEAGITDSESESESESELAERRRRSLDDDLASWWWAYWKNEVYHF
ncbi:hypothetical protein HRG_006125 [Hirsutella rhossiliensis]|uniref:Metalloprotease n=1 Tax=Hirsutella rhossiliensis TaxID=111463 RepID=A0A9P8MYJ5_9HYPO|nr:uncharacterized protein HRG_06125 [Hirsutella rhossiliensis]KAH0963615.1 hypothetical protein HRG_06125 [Hirsutella rhossiliensis]